LENILVPVGGGYHSKFAVQVAESLAKADNGSVDVVRVVDEELMTNNMKTRWHICKRSL
jgi:hypothetical protein